MAKNRRKNKVNNSNSPVNNTVNNGLAGALDLPANTNAYNPVCGQVDNLYNYASPAYLTYQWILISNIYKSCGFVQNAINQIVDDAFRNEGLIIESATLETDELEDLRRAFYEKDLEPIKAALCWGQLYGGGCLIAKTNQDFKKAINKEKLEGANLEFIDSDRWHCSTNGANLRLAQSLVLTSDGNVSNEQAITIDRSRVEVFTGGRIPIFERQLLQGWGQSILETLWAPLCQYLKAMGVTLELLDEAKIDIIKIFGLADTLMSQQGDAKIRQRLEVVTQNKNYKSSIAMDAQDDYQQKQISFSGLPEMIEKIQYLICAELKRPYSKVWGKGSSGFSSGEDDLENYNAIVDSELRTPALPMIKWALKLRCWQMFGREPDLRLDWKPLRVMSEKDEAEINSRTLADYLQLADRQIMKKQQVARKLTEDGIVIFSDEEIAAISDDFEPENYNKPEDLLID